MTRIKISFLFGLGLFIVLFAVFQSTHLKEDREVHQNEKKFLTWDGSQIIVTKDSSTAEKYHAKNSLPAEMHLMFFQPIPLNHADVDLLSTVPGIGPVTAGLILRKRLELGSIISSEQLMSIKGIGEKKATLIEQHTTYDL